MIVAPAYFHTISAILLGRCDTLWRWLSCIGYTWWFGVGDVLSQISLQAVVHKASCHIHVQRMDNIRLYFRHRHRLGLIFAVDCWTFTRCTVEQSYKTWTGGRKCPATQLSFLPM